MKVHSNVRIPAPLLNNFTSRKARNNRKKLNLMVASFYKKNKVLASINGSSSLSPISSPNILVRGRAVLSKTLH